MIRVPLLIDGNNLMHALAGAGVEVGRAGLCRLLERARLDFRRVHVVFDGPPRGQIAAGAVQVTYSGQRSADDILAECIAADTAPRRLTVVSTDHQVRRAARRRRCRTETSESFARRLVRALRRDRRAEPPEPPEKQTGLTEAQTRRWLRELGLERQS